MKANIDNLLFSDKLNQQNCFTESYKNRSGEPEKAFLAVRTPDGARTWAQITGGDEVPRTVQHDIAGAAVQVRSDGTATLA